MNDPEVIMPNSQATNRFIAHDAALEAAAAAIKLVRRIPTPLKSIADQVIRSAASVPANLARTLDAAAAFLGPHLMEFRMNPTFQRSNVSTFKRYGSRILRAR